MYYFSSTLWGVICLALAVILAELCRSLSTRRLARWLPALLLVALPLAYEADPHLPAFGWLPTGVGSGRGPGRVQRWPAVGQARTCGAPGFPRRV